MRLPAWLALAALAFLAACSSTSRLPVSAGIGPDPVLPPPEQTLLPVVNIAPAKGWPQGDKPSAAPGLEVVAFAADLDHPRWLQVLPNGDVLVAETDAPPKPQDYQGIRGWLTKRLMRRAGSGHPSADRITLLRDTDGDGIADQRATFLQGLHSPFGMALIGEDFYVANTDAILRFPYVPGQTQITAVGAQVLELPAGPINHHWTKNILANPSGNKLYIAIGSNSNAGEKGLDQEAGRAAIWELDLATRQHRIFASGLRNPVGMAWEPETGALWATVNERDELGNDLVPDYLTSVREGGFYGWPYSYFGQHLDPRVQPQRPDLVAQALVPDYALGAHTASLGLAAAQGNRLGERFQQGMFVGQHGSWNRKPHSGYKVIFIPFRTGRPAGPPVDVLIGFLDQDGNALGRPVGVAIDRQGGLLVADDVGDVIWRVTAAAAD